MDLLQGVQDVLQENADVDPGAQTGENEAASLEKLLKIVEKLNLSVENKAQLEGVLKKKAAMGMLDKFMPDAFKNMGDLGNQAEAEAYDGPILFVYLLVLVSLVLLVLVFFGYKLYRSHADRERKREEKRRLKQQKKKK